VDAGALNHRQDGFFTPARSNFRSEETIEIVKKRTKTSMLDGTVLETLCVVGGVRYPQSTTAESESGGYSPHSVAQARAKPAAKAVRHSCDHSHGPLQTSRTGERKCAV
jgi:hypothetical protein